MDQEFLKEKATQHRLSVLKCVADVGKGHLGGALSAMEVLCYLFYHFLTIDSEQPDNPTRDRFLLSKGHAAIGLYPILADLGFFSRDELDRFNQFSGRLGEHPDRHIPGIEINSGSLGHGIGIGCGIALGSALDNISHKTVVLMGDGECYEGSVWESALFASHHQLSDLIVVIDRNHHCVQDKTEHIIRLEPLADKWQAFGWQISAIDGHDFKAIDQAFRATDQNSQPQLIIANTVKGKGISFMEDQSSWHHGSLSIQHYKQACDELTR